MTHIPPVESMREEITRRVAAFRDRQRRFNEARDAYSKQTFARLRADLTRDGAAAAHRRESPHA